MEFEQYYSENFYNAVLEQGEDLSIYYVSPDGEINEYPVKASIVTATSAAYNMTDREYLFKGDMTLPEGLHRRYLSGCYVKRSSYPNKTYLMLSVISSPVSEKLAYIYMIQCTNEVTLCEPVEIEDEWENTKEAFVPYAKDIHGYFSTVLRTMKSTNDGSLDQTIYSLVLPARFPVSPFQRIIKKSYQDGTYKDVNYQVESVSTDMLDFDKENEQFLGIISLQLSEDLRAGTKTIDGNSLDSGIIKIKGTKYGK